ncbi:MAG: sigma-70 family RNA polymerase sigma factor [Gemmataceae bacterium]
MTQPSLDTLQLHDLVDRFRDGDRAAADALLRAVAGQLDRLARRMIRNFPRVRAGADTADVVQCAMIRLTKALGDVRPNSTREFAGLAALQVRRELLDLARHFTTRLIGPPVPDPETGDWGTGGGDDPAGLELWARFHAAADALPAEEREAFGLLFYNGHTRAEAALLLGVSERTVYRWWAAACERLVEQLGGELPT